MRRLIRPAKVRISTSQPPLGGLAMGVSRLSDDDREALADELALLTGGSPDETVGRTVATHRIDGTRTRFVEDGFDDGFDPDTDPDEATPIDLATVPSVGLPPRRPLVAGPVPVVPAATRVHASEPDLPTWFFMQPGDAPPADLWDHAMAADEGRPQRVPAPPGIDPATIDPPEVPEVDEAAIAVAIALADGPSEEELDAWHEAVIAEAEAAHAARMAQAEAAHAALMAELEAEAACDDDDGDDDEWALIADDLESDAEDWARSEEDGWFYDDE